MKGMMNHSIRVRHQSWPSAARTAASVIAMAALALLAGACSGGPSASSPNGAGAASADEATSHLVAYSHCIRSHGVPGYPDPTSGEPPKGSAQQFGVSTAQFQAAQGACRHLLPTAQSFHDQVQQCMLGGNCPQALVQQILTAGRKFAECMRSHGVPNWPDPTIDSLGRPVFNLSTGGITHSQAHSGPLAAKITECMRLEPAPVALG
jgi:hypothetical protein